MTKAIDRSPSHRVFEAADQRAVIELKERADFAYDRLLPAYLPREKETQS